MGLAGDGPGMHVLCFTSLLYFDLSLVLGFKLNFIPKCSGRGWEAVFIFGCGPPYRDLNPCTKIMTPKINTKTKIKYLKSGSRNQRNDKENNNNNTCRYIYILLYNGLWSRFRIILYFFTQ